MDTVLDRLLACHATPGDEGEVCGVLSACWRAAGWNVERLGEYALSARIPDGTSDGTRPVLLVCAHMDSPGYAVDRLAPLPSPDPAVVRFGVAELGRPELVHCAAAVLKTTQGRFCGELIALDEEDEDGPDAAFECSAADAAVCGVRHGDRVCFAPTGARVRGDLLHGAFLDNRLGCWALARLADEARTWRTAYEVVLGATAMEEMSGFGARVLAAHVRPAAVLVLGTTYESAAQGVRLGGGPALTLSDASVFVSPARRDRLAEVLSGAGLPFQTEVYNFSGTDARAFPEAGLAGPVVPLLIPTRGNHAPVETADRRDLDAWPKALRALAEGFF